MRRRGLTSVSLSDRQFDQIVAFLQDWLPDDAKDVYREMIRDNPQAWWQDPHFAGGIIIEHALRGNGINERALGIKDLSRFWPELLARAVANGDYPKN